MPYIDYDAFDPDAPLFIATSISALSRCFHQTHVETPLTWAAVMGSGLGAAVGFAKNINPFEAGWALGRRWLILSSAFYGMSLYPSIPFVPTSTS